MANTDRDNRENAYLARREREWCRCGWPDMPGQCPGWRNCPMCETDDDEDDATVYG